MKSVNIAFDNYQIREIRSEDAQSYFELINENKGRIVKYFSEVTRENKDLSSAVSFIEERIKLQKERVVITLVVCEIRSQKIIGSIFLKNFDRSVKKCELSFFIDRNYEGKGIFTKAVSLITEYSFRSLGLNKIYLRIAYDNLSSRRVAEKNGFNVEGFLLQDFRTPDGRLIDIIYFGLLNNL